MLKKLKRKLPFFLGVLAFSSLGLALSSCAKVEGYRTQYIVEAGEVFYLPTDLGELEVRENAGGSVSVANGAFLANSLKGYTIEVKDGKQAISVQVVDTTAPQIYGDGYFSVEVGKSVDLSSIAAVDLVNGEVETYLYEGTKPIQSKKYTPTEAGKYVLTVKAEDYLGNESEREITVSAFEKGDRKLERITAYSTVYGEKQIRSLNGVHAEFSDEERYDEKEEGSLKVVPLLDMYGNASCSFTLGEVFHNDLSATNGVYFQVKNGSGHSVNLKFSSSYVFVLQANEWNEIYFSMEDLALIAEETKTDVVGTVEKLRFTITSLGYVRAGASPLYFSDIYYLPKMDTETFRSRVSKLALSDIPTKDGLAEWTYLHRIYANYGMGDMNNIADLYGMLDKMYLQAFSTASNTTYEQGKVAYAESALGAKQFVSPDLSASFSYDESFVNANGGKGSTKVRVGDAWGASLKLAYPYVDGEYSTTDVDVYEDSIYGTVTFGVYWKGQSQKQMLVRFNGQTQAITSGEWNEVTFKLYNQSFKNATLYFYAGSDVVYGGWLSNTEFYLSSFYVTKAITVDEVEGKIDALINANISAKSFLNSEQYQDTIKAYNELSVSKRSLVSNKEALRKEMQAKLSAYYGVEMSGNKVFFFDSELGVRQVNPVNATVEYSTEIRYGEEAGSLKITSERAWEAGVDLLFPFNKSSNLADSYTFRVYLEGARNVTVQFATYNSYSEDLVLTAGRWTEITIPKGMLLEENRLYAFVDGWNALLPAGVTVYLSAMYANS